MTVSERDNPLLFYFDMKEVFQNAVAKVWGKEGKNWMQGEFESVGHYCLVGGIARALVNTHADGFNGFDQDYFDGEQFDNIEDLSNFIVDDLDELLLPLVQDLVLYNQHDTPSRLYNSIWEYNDNALREFEDIIDLIDKATDEINDQQFNGGH